MKYIKTLLILIAFLIPNITLAAYPGGWSATSTTQGWITPNLINGLVQKVVTHNFIASFFTATSTTASTFPYASTTALTTTNAYITNLSNLSTGLVKVTSGALSVDTTTYQPAGNYITALTGDVTASGPGSAAATLATVNSDVGSYTNANITVNAKGLITAASNGTGGTGGTGNVATSSAETKGQLPYWTSTSGTPATLGSVATTSVTCSGSTSCTSFTVIGSSPVSISSSGAGITGGTANMLASWVDATNLTATGTPQAASFIATSTTATSTFAGSVMIGTAMNSGMMTPGGGIVNTGKVPLQTSTEINDLTNSFATGNMSQGAYAADCHSQYNASTSPFLGLTATNYYAGCFTGPNFNSATAPGGGLIYGSVIPGLPANSYVQVVQPGAMLFGALGTDTTKAWMSWSIGTGYQMGNFDMILKSVDTAYTNTASGGLGIGTTTPTARLSLAASSTAPFDYMNVYQHVNGVTSAVPVFNVNKNENVGVSTSTPWARLSIDPNAITGPAFVIGSSTRTSVIVDNGGKTGLGTTTPLGILSIQSTNRAASTNVPLLVIASSSSAVSQKTHLIVGNNGNVAIGGTNTTGQLTIFGDSSDPNQGFYNYRYGGSAAPAFITIQARGTEFAPSATQTGDGLFFFGSRGYGTSQYSAGSVGAIGMSAADTYSNTSNPTYIYFSTTPVGSVTRAERLRIDSNGYVGIGTTAPGQRLEIEGGIKYNTATSKPTCDSSVRGTTWYVRSGAGVKDTFEVCAKDAGDAYAWRTIY